MLLDADDDIQLRRALVYHSYVDARGGDGCEYSRRGTARLDHSASDDRDERHIVLDGDAVGAQRTAQSVEYAVAPALKSCRFEHNAHCVNAGGEMLEGDAVFLEYFKHAPAERRLGVHHVLLERYDGEPALSRNAGYHVLAVVILRGGDYHGAGVLRAQRVADIYRYTGISDREDSFLVQHRGAHIRKLAQLAVCYGLYGQRVVDYARISHLEARNIRPVFVKVRLRRARDDRARHVRAAARKGLDGLVRHNPVKAGNDGTFVLRQLRAHDLLCAIGVKCAGVCEIYHVFGVDKVVAEVFRKYQPREILAAAGGVVASRTARYRVFDVEHFVRNIKVEPQLVDYRVIAFAYPVEISVRLFYRRALAHEPVKLIEHIRDLYIASEALARRRGDYISAGLVRSDYRRRHFEMFRVAE
ncbi:unknown [Anaerotruncus sp. CAG:390]|nr:unknown [Anaerotruncus sp. CAG:390]